MRKLFEFSDEILSEIDKKYSKVLKEYDTTIHVRKGDYTNLSDIYHNLTHLYYFRATTVLAVKKAVIFSDDIEWCKNIFKDTDCFFVSETEERVVEERIANGRGRGSLSFETSAYDHVIL